MHFTQSQRRFDLVVFARFSNLCHVFLNSQNGCICTPVKAFDMGYPSSANRANISLVSEDSITPQVSEFDVSTALPGIWPHGHNSH